MYITQEELDRRLTKTEVSIKKKERAVRGEEKRLSHEDRVIIGVLDGVDTQKNIADLVGVSQTTVSNVSRGMVAPASGVDKKLKTDINERIEDIGERKLEQERKIEEQLIDNLAIALGHVANNLHSTDAPEASKIALDMSRILDRVGGNSKGDKGNKTAIIINVPSMKQEKDYQVIEVSS